MATLVSLIKSAWIAVGCPSCGIENSVRVADAALGRRVMCRGCHQTIQLVDKDVSTVRTFRAINAAMEDLRAALSKFH